MARLSHRHLNICDMNRNLPPPLVADALARGKIIQAIKLLRTHRNMDLHSAKLQVESWLHADAEQLVTQLLARYARADVSVVVDKNKHASEHPMKSATAPRLPPTSEMALHCGERHKVARLIFDHYPQMPLREAITRVERYHRLELSVGAGGTGVAGNRVSVWCWAMLGLLCAVAGAAWWLYR